MMLLLSDLWKNGMKASGNSGSTQAMHGPPDWVHMFTPPFHRLVGQSALARGPLQPRLKRQLPSEKSLSRMARSKAPLLGQESCTKAPKNAVGRPYRSTSILFPESTSASVSSSQS